MWHPEDIGVTIASAAIPYLKLGLNTLIDHPEIFHKFNPSNGWGSYGNLVDVAGKYLDACEKYPNSMIKAET
jgi:hypothetical protein